MKQIEKHIIKECDVCGEAAYYDTPTTEGPWANLCELHFETIGIETSVTTKFKYTTKG
jgi:hypothetical protein